MVHANATYDRPCPIHAVSGPLFSNIFISTKIRNIFNLPKQFVVSGRLRKIVCGAHFAFLHLMLATVYRLGCFTKSLEVEGCCVACGVGPTAAPCFQHYRPDRTSMWRTSILVSMRMLTHVCTRQVGRAPREQADLEQRLRQFYNKHDRCVCA